MAKFENAYLKTAAVEGGYVNHPNDKGKETYKGIARKYNPDWSGWTMIDSFKSDPTFPKNIKHEALDASVKSFYKTRFWDSISLDEVSDEWVAAELYDTGVNMGPAIAIKMLQRALNLLNSNGASYPNLTIDGKIGPKTISTLNSHKYPITVFNLLNILQGMRYVELAETDPTQEVFMRGWLNTRVVMRNLL